MDWKDVFATMRTPAFWRFYGYVMLTRYSWFFLFGVFITTVYIFITTGTVGVSSLIVFAIAAVIVAVGQIVRIIHTSRTY